MVDSPWAETALDDFEAASFAEDHGRGGDPDVSECDVAVAVRGIVVAIHGEHAVYFDPRGGGGHEEHGLLGVGVGVRGGGFAHYEVDLAAWVASAGRPPFLAPGSVNGHVERDGYGSLRSH